MNRTLRRPMFRMGGAAEGITSGLDKPRQQYQSGMTVAPMPSDAIRRRIEANTPKINDAALQLIMDSAKERGQFKDDINMQTTGDAATGGLSRQEIR
jgi:hypothetical protein